MSLWSRLVERQILKARAEGKLSALEGEGRPLPAREATVDPGLAAGLRMMAEAGVVPEEFRLKAEADTVRAEWRAATDPGERRRLMARIADLDMRHAIARDARRRFLS